MPKSKPPRRRYRPLRRIHDFDERMMTMFDMLEAANEKLRQRVTPFLDQIPAKERAAVLGQLADARQDIANGRSGVLAPSATPVLDALLQEDRERRRALGG
jgi:hypothetical protein